MSTFLVRLTSRIGSLFFDREDIVALDDLLDRYLTFGGLPFLVASKLPEQEMKDYIWSTYQTIVGRDILAREARRG